MTQRGSDPQPLLVERNFPSTKILQRKTSIFGRVQQPPTERPVDASRWWKRTVVRHGRPIGSRVTSPPASCRARRLAGRRAGPRPRRAAPTAIMNANAGASGTPVGLNVRGRESNVDLVDDFPSSSFPSLRSPLDSLPRLFRLVKARVA